MQSSPDIAIIGGGIIGLTTAYYLAREGFQVLVLDRGDLGQEASWAGAGIIPFCDAAKAKTPWEQLRAFSCQQFPILSKELAELTGVDNGFRRSGGLELANFVEAGHEDEWRQDSGSDGQLTPKQLAELEPHLAADIGPAYHLANMAQVRNPRHMRALQTACQQKGVQLKTQCPVHALLREKHRIAGLATADGVVRAERFLITAGAWSEALLKETGWQPGIRPIRGQMVLLKTKTSPIQRILLAGARYLVPRDDGRILVGSTEEDVGFEKCNTAVAVEELLDLAFRLVPTLEAATLERYWSGLRPGSPDGLPYLGQVPDLENLFIAAGHFRAGVLLSPGTGLVMKQLLLSESTAVPLAAFRLDRF